MGHSLDDLALLVDVVRAGGVRAVARAQGLPRSTVSRRLARLEEDLGVRLTQRGSGALALSDDAEASFERLARLVDEARDLSAELTTRGREPRGVLRMATTPIFAEHVLPDLLATYLAKYPAVRFELLSSTERIDLAAERVDVAIRGGPLEDSTSFTAKRLGTLTVGFFASPAYLARRGTPQSPAELADHDLLVSTTRSAGGQWGVQRKDRREQLRVVGRVHAANENFLLELAERGAGIVRAPTYVVAERLRRGRFVPVLEATWLHSEVNVVYPLGAPPRTAAFVELLVKAFAHGPPWERGARAPAQATRR
jgi:DNA-binding transcriptional LysR family regulator